MTDANKVMAGGLRVVEELQRLRWSAIAEAGKPPHFLVVPWDAVDDLQSIMTNVCLSGGGKGRSFRGSLVLGEVRIEGIPVHAGASYGWGYYRG